MVGRVPSLQHCICCAGKMVLHLVIVMIMMLAMVMMFFVKIMTFSPLMPPLLFGWSRLLTNQNFGKNTKYIFPNTKYIFPNTKYIFPNTKYTIQITKKTQSQKPNAPYPIPLPSAVHSLLAPSVSLAGSCQISSPMPSAQPP